MEKKMELSEESFLQKNWPELTACILGTIFLAVITGATLNDWVISVAVFLSLWIIFKTPFGKKLEQFFINVALWSVGLSPKQHKENRYEHSDVIRAGGLTLVMMVPIMIGVLGATTTFIDVFNCSPTTGQLGGIGWGICVFFIDRALILTMKRKANGKYPLGGFFIRFGVAFFLGVLISASAELRWFKTEIQEERNMQMIEQRDAIKKLEKAEIAIVDQKIAKERKRVDDMYQAVKDEVDNPPGGREAKYGPEAKRKEAWADKAQKKLDEEILPVLEADKAEIRQRYNIRKQNLESNNSNGFAARMEYLFDAGKRHPLIGIWHFVIFAFLIIIELLPVTVKMIMPAGPNDFKIMEELLIYEQLYMAVQLNTLKEEQKLAMTSVQNLNALNIERQKGSFDLTQQSVTRTMDIIKTIGKQRGPTKTNHSDLVIAKYLDSIKDPTKHSVKLKIA